MAAQVFGNSAVALQLNQAFRGSAPSNAVFNNQKEAVADMGDSAFANAFAADYVPVGADSADDFVELSNTILGNLNLLPPTTDADKAEDLQEALPQLLFAFKDQVGQVVLNLTNIMRGLESDPNWGAAATLYNQQQAAALSYSSNPTNTGESNAEPEPESLVLTVGQDGITGTSAADTFTANVVQNAGGAQVNTLGSGDILDGGSGVDTLMAKITNGVFAGGAWSMPIQPETESIEVMKLEAVWADISGGSFISVQDSGPSLGRNTVFVNAKDLVDVTEIGSYRSDADLIIQNMTTKSSGGDIRNLSEMTVSMAYTGNSDHLWDESDLSVYFDQDYLNPERTVTQPSIDLFAMNEDGYDETDGEEPLAGVYFAKLEVTLNGETFDLAEFIDEDPEGDGTEIVNYDDMLAAIQDAIAAVQAEHPDNAALQSMVAVMGDDFEADISPVTGLRRVGSTITIKVDGQTEGEDNTLTVQATDLVLDPTEGAEVANSNRFERAEATPPQEGQVLAINIDLEKVGLAGDGGSLTVGSMYKHLDNVWSAEYAGKGINEFNVTVYGGGDKPSSLSSLQSTGNNLRVVTVESDAAQTGTFADLEIGNSNTETYALKDVQTFDASAFKGDLSLQAGLSSEIRAKYLNSKDVQGDPSADNVDFEYSGGVGNDSIAIAVTSSNFDTLGAATREDFTLNIDGGDGNDKLNMSIRDSDGLASDVAIGLSAIGFANWYDNQKLNANLSMDGGAGNDTISKPGSGDVVIDAGTGDDTVYADNTGALDGAKRSWIFNTLTDNSVHNSLGNAQSDANDRYQIHNGKLTVTYRGLEVTVALPSTNGYVTDLQVNQAIKSAINGNAVLSKLLEATDGPANTLVVRAKIDQPWDKGDKETDGDLELTELTIDLSAPKTLTASEVSQLANWYSLPGSNAASLLAVMNSSIDAFDAKGDYDNTDDQKISDGGDDVGRYSIHTSDNTITPGLGNDVIVLGTGANSNDTVVYEGFGNGTDTIVNFETDDTGEDFTVTVTPASTAKSEKFTASFSDLTVTPNSGGATITLNLGTPAVPTVFNLDIAAPGSDVLRAVDIAYEISSQVVAGWTLDWKEGTSQVTFTRVATGNYDNDGTTAGDQDVTATNFVVSGATGGAVSVSGYVDGTDAFVAATKAYFEVDLNGSAAIANDTFVFSYDNDGAGSAAAKTVNIAYLLGDGPITLANKLVAALNGTGDWVAETNNDGIVSAVRSVGGLLDLDTYVWALNGTEITDAQTNGLVIAVATFGDEDGSDQIGTAAVTQVIAHSDGLDYLDFSAYDAVAVFVDDVLVAGSTPTSGQEYVRMTESTTNDGEYKMEVLTEAGTTDTLVGTIGIADFGDYVDVFVAENFIL